ncbi:POTRA domain-containing protein, partial [Escherichia sp. R-CC3]
MRYIRQLCCVSLLCLSGSAVAANVRLQVEGLSGQLEKNVRAQLSTIESDEVTPDRRFRARVDDAIREGLKALGYYQPVAESRRFSSARSFDSYSSPSLNGTRFC